MAAKSIHLRGILAGHNSVGPPFLDPNLWGSDVWPKLGFSQYVPIAEKELLGRLKKR